MNQILYTSNGKPSGPLPIKKVVKFFAVCMIILGIILFVEGTYNLFSVNLSDNKNLDNTVPQITFAKDGNIATISVTHNKGISKVKYHWNDGEENIVNGNSDKEIAINDIALPAGINVLHVEAIDDNGKSQNSSYEYSYDGIAIDLSVVNNSDIKIIASDITGMSYMTYKWNSNEEIKVYPNEKGEIYIEQTTEIPSGLNTLYISAVNSSNITLSKKQEIKGNKRPEISFYIMDMTLHVSVHDEEGIDTVTQQINLGDEKVYEANGQKDFSYEYYIGEEEILVTITATDVDGVSRTIKGKNY